MAQKREKDETDMKVPENFYRPIPIRSLPEHEDPTLDNPIRKVSNAADESRPSISLIKATEIPDLSLSSSSFSGHINRCSGCRRKVGLTGFRCRCGEMFCREHRYSDRHDCSFDYKAAGREAIARENPLVRASKILKV